MGIKTENRMLSTLGKSSRNLVTGNWSRRRFITSIAALTAGGVISPSVFAKVLTDTTSSGHWSGYKDSIVIDGLSAAFDYGVDYIDEETLAIFRASGITALNATIPAPGDNFDTANKKVLDALRVINKYPSHLSLVKSVSDILSAKKNNQLGVIIGFQSTEMFGDDLSTIKHFADMGARYMQLSYNGPSQFGAGGLVAENTGLTELGRGAIEEMESNKVLVDLSHSGQKTVREAIKQSKRPLTISHTGCNAIYQHPRNNNDAELKAVADKGGVVGIYLMPFLEGGDGEITAEIFCKHVDHALNICGEDHVSIGSDQGVVPVNDGPEYREMIRKEVERRIAAGISAPGETPNRPPFIPQLNAVNRMELIAIHLEKRGYKSATIEKILGTNLLHLYQQVW